ncbi:transposase [Anaerocolumna cellulosilytica]|uniref:Transposase n=1 Tax=Anaerocolumna cellulosilytica TaxID=433286 RepID=A0A6S6R7T4_9FIRM|nr:ISNCY family transposase [Anaerocolumna cellulosilytica]BCJ95096.1 transposase [Anaerocolumna cellulosilytica]BCJ95305.1 transposase [Anaerocolumna cellulosilytica]BCJ95532.1 transposase [Anaerocolumna cellulosilytica]
MRKVKLTMNEEKRYEVIKKLVDTNGNKKNAALKIGCTERHINRMIAGYKRDGKSFFIHGNRGRTPAHALSKETKQTVLDLYRSKYFDTNFTHCIELLEKYEGISISVSTLNSILEKEYILSPKATRSKKRKTKLKLKHLKTQTKSKKILAELQSNIVAIEDAHSRRPRCAYFGEMLQMDASIHLWFGDTKTQLHIAVDDATGTIVGAYFDEQETLKGYYNVFHQVLTEYGIPYLFFTDNRTVFEYKQKNAPSIEEDTYTQFAYACKQLGVEIKTSSIPQAKGRVERLFQTLQSRLPVELRLAGINTLSEANAFLNSYIKEYNAKFALETNLIKSVFEKQPVLEEINLVLSVLTERKIDNGHCLKFKNKYFKTLDKNGHQVHFYKGTKAMVIEAFDGNKYCCIDESIYALEAIPSHEKISKNFDLTLSQNKTIKRKIPGMHHPWRRQEFWRFVKMQEHHWNDEVPA